MRAPSVALKVAAASVVMSTCLASVNTDLRGASAVADELRTGLHWAPQRTLSSDTRISTFPLPRVVVTEAGRVVAVWIAHRTRFGPGQVYAAVRPAGSPRWRQPRRLTSLDGRVFDFEAARSGHNAVTVAYEGFGVGGEVVLATRTLRPTGWTPPRTVSRWSDPSGVVEDLGLGSNANGDQVAAWRQNAFLMAARRHGSEAAWGPARRLRAGAQSAAAFVDSAGRGLVVASGQPKQGGIGLIFERGRGGPWTHRRFAQATTGHSITAISAAMNPRGDLVVGWERTLEKGTGQCPPCVAAVRVRPAGGNAFEPARTLEKAGDARPQVTIGSRGVATVMWQHLTPTRVGLRVARLGHTGIGDLLFSTSQLRPPPPCCSTPAPIEAESNADNAALFLFRATRPSLHEPGVAVTRCKAARPCGPVHLLPNRHVEIATLAAEPRGAATVVWPDDCVFDPIIEECEFRTVQARRLAHR